MQTSRVSRIVIVVGVCLLLGGCDWTMRGYDAGNSGYNPTETAVNADGVANLREQWRATTGSTSFGYPAVDQPVVANGRLFVDGYDGHLHAFAANGAGCAGPVPATCSPVWTSTGANNIGGTVAVSGGLVFDSGSDELDAYDASGVAGCWGTPTTCAPVWKAVIPGAAVLYAPVVASGIIYLLAGDLYAFDAAGKQGCGGVPRTCAPLWRYDLDSPDYGTADGSTPIVNDGRVVISSIKIVSLNDVENFISVFDASGTSGCSGSPMVCTPLWRTSESHPTYAMVAASGLLYAATIPGASGAQVDVFDLTHPDCSASGVCSPRWTTTATGRPSADGAITLAVGGGELYLIEDVAIDPDPLQLIVDAFDAFGVTGCTGTPALCAPLWSTGVDDLWQAPPVIAGGLLWLAGAQRIAAYDAAGSRACNATHDACSPLWTAIGPNQLNIGLIVADGWVYDNWTDMQHTGVRAFTPGGA
jgi:outer membrane protein assembly factor BamB